MSRPTRSPGCGDSRLGQQPVCAGRWRRRSPTCSGVRSRETTRAGQRRWTESNRPGRNPRPLRFEDRAGHQAVYASAGHSQAGRRRSCMAANTRLNRDAATLHRPPGKYQAPPGETSAGSPAPHRAGDRPEVLLLADAQTSGGLLRVGRVPGYRIVGGASRPIGGRRHRDRDWSKLVPCCSGGGAPQGPLASECGFDRLQQFRVVRSDGRCEPRQHRAVPANGELLEIPKDLGVFVGVDAKLRSRSRCAAGSPWRAAQRRSIGRTAGACRCR
jgi:hypothetical protein